MSSILRELSAELDRLRAENLRLRIIVQQVAAFCCPFEGTWTECRQDGACCLYCQARAMLEERIEKPGGCVNTPGHGQAVGGSQA